ncbi:methyltransferase domain-containing protein [Lentzea sp. NPDC004789]
MWPNVEVRRADAGDADHEAGEFDAAVTLGAFSAMTDVPAATANAAEALKPGGRLFVFDVRLARKTRGSCGRPTAGSRGSTAVVVARKVTGTATGSGCTPCRPVG